MNCTTYHGATHIVKKCPGYCSVKKFINCTVCTNGEVYFYYNELIGYL